MIQQNETREEAAARFQAAFWAHQDERTPHNKNDPEGKKNTHKHLPSRAQLAEWVDALKEGTETQFASGQERHWAKSYLRLEGEDVIWKSSGKLGVPDAKVLCVEDWALRILDAHVTKKGVHRGRDATYEWLRDPIGGCKKPQGAPAGTVFYKAPMKEVVMAFISGCPVCKSKCGSGNGSGNSSKKRKGTSSPTDDDDNNNNQQNAAPRRPRKKRATGRTVSVALATAAAAATTTTTTAQDAQDPLGVLDAPADAAGFEWDDWGLPFPAEERFPGQGNFSYGLDNVACAPALAPAPGLGLAPVGGLPLERGGTHHGLPIDPALLGLGPTSSGGLAAPSSSIEQPEVAESLQPVRPTLDSAPAQFLPLSDEELGIEVGNAILGDVGDRVLGFAGPQENANSSNNGELNMFGLQDANSFNEELNSFNLEDSCIFNWQDLVNWVEYPA